MKSQSGPVGRLAQQEVARGVGPEAKDERHRVDHVAGGLRELAALARDEALPELARRHRHASRVEHCRPVQAVEADDVLANEVQPLVGAHPVVAIVGRVVGEAEGRDVVAERVDPHVEDVVRLLGDRDPPLHPRAADAEVLEPLLDHPEDLVPSRLGADLQRVALDRLAQPALVGRQPEEEVLLLRPLAGSLVIGADVARLLQLLLVLEALAARAVPARVGAAVDGVAPVGCLRDPQLLPEAQHAALVDQVGGADEAVVADVVALPQLAEGRRDPVAVLLLGDALLARDTLDVLAVLVGAGQEEDVVAGEPARARERVGRDRGVRVADVRHVVHVVDRRRQVERALGGGHAGFPDPERQAASAAARTSFTATPASAARRWQSSNSGHAL